MKNFFQYQNLKGLANIWAGGIPNTRGRYRSPKWRESIMDNNASLLKFTVLFVSLARVWFSSQKITKIFSFFVCLSWLCGIELSQSTLKFFVSQLKHHWNQRPRSLKILIEIISLLNFSFIVIAKILIQSLTDEVHSRMNYIF